MSSQNSVASKTEILEAAAELVQETAATFTINDLAAHTGLSRATIYRQVGGKKALLKQLAQAQNLPHLDQPDMPQRILQAARRLFGQQGLVSPTMEQIAAEAGVGVATVYRHFGDRSTLLKTFLQTFQPELPISQTETSGDLRTDLTRLVESMIRFILQNQDMVQHSFSHAQQWHEELAEVRPFRERSLIRIGNFLQSQMEAGKLRPVDPKKAATALAGLILSFSIIMPTYYQSPEPEPQETAVFITELFLNGLLVNP